MLSDLCALLLGALALEPDSTRERLNCGLALLRAGDTEPGVVEQEWNTQPALRLFRSLAASQPQRAY